MRDNAYILQRATAAAVAVAAHNRFHISLHLKHFFFFAGRTNQKNTVILSDLLQRYLTFDDGIPSDMSNLTLFGIHILFIHKFYITFYFLPTSPVNATIKIMEKKVLCIITSYARSEI